MSAAAVTSLVLGILGCVPADYRPPRGDPGDRRHPHDALAERRRPGHGDRRPSPGARWSRGLGTPRWRPGYRIHPVEAGTRRGRPVHQGSRYGEPVRRPRPMYDEHPAAGAGRRCTADERVGPARGHDLLAVQLRRLRRRRDPHPRRQSPPSPTLAPPTPSDSNAGRCRRRSYPGCTTTVAPPASMRTVHAPGGATANRIEDLLAPAASGDNAGPADPKLVADCRLTPASEAVRRLSLRRHWAMSAACALSAGDEDLDPSRQLLTSRSSNSSARRSIILLCRSQSNVTYRLANRRAARA